MSNRKKGVVFKWRFCSPKGSSSERNENEIVWFPWKNFNENSVLNFKETESETKQVVNRKLNQAVVLLRIMTKQPRKKQPPNPEENLQGEKKLLSSNWR